MASAGPFAGTIGRTYRKSEPWWPPRPEDAHGPRPNVLIVLLDDTGFAHLGCYGSAIETPHVDALATNGLRYSNFHVTPLCSPTRAALLTGRNHHSVGMGKLSSYNDAGFPSMRGRISEHAATLAEMLQSTGYATFALGKWHLAPFGATSAAGPYDDWPLRRGFDRYYGFFPGQTDQFYPELMHDNHPVDPPASPEDGYHLTEDLVDRAIGFLRDKQSLRPRQSFFMYFALGATHEPHQAPQAYRDKYRGRFDAGWDIERAACYQRQLASGIIPPKTVLAPRNPGVTAWDAIPANERRFMARLQEAFAAYLDHTDVQIGRLVDYLRESGQLDDTIVIVLADNGASQGGGPTGIMRAGPDARGATNDGRVAGEANTANPRPLVVDDVDRVDLDEIGGPRSHADIPWGWAQVGNTPLRWYKGDVHGGGVRVPLIVHWPARINAPGIRHQFHYVNDVVPTVLELIGVEPPARYRGVDQMPVSGTGFAYTFDQPDGASRKPAQYFEMSGHRGIWDEGWKAVTRHARGAPFSDDEWELYHVAQDFSETTNLAAAEPDRLRDMIDRWWVEAGRHGALPLDDRAFVPAASRQPGAATGPARFHFTPPISHLPYSATPPWNTGAWTLTAAIDRPDSSAEGVIVAMGSIINGVSLYVQGNRLQLDYNVRTQITSCRSITELPPGEITVGARLSADREGGGQMTLTVEGQDAGTIQIPELASRTIHQRRGGMSIGLDRLSPVSDRYDAPFPFSATIHSVDLEITPFARAGGGPTAAQNPSPQSGEAR